MGCERQSAAPPAQSAAPTPAPAATPAAPATATPKLAPEGYLLEAQPRLPTLKLWIGPKEMVAEMALTLVQIRTGMMHRTEMAENDGMLFVFPQPMKVGFYMRNTKIPLSCAYISAEGEILEIHDLVPLDETAVEAKTDKIQYVLETNKGWFERNGIGVGTIIRSEHGALSETFVRRPR